MSGKMSRKHAENSVAKPDKRNLSADAVKTMVNLYQTSRITQRDLADQFNISKSSLNRILKANQITIRKEEKPKENTTGEKGENCGSIKSFESFKDLEKFVGETNVPKDKQKTTTEEEDYKVYADEFHDYSVWFIKYVKNEKEKLTNSYKNVVKELKEEKKARERLQNVLDGKLKMVTDLTKENASLKAELKIANDREKELGQKSQKKVKCVCCDAQSKFKVKDKMVCSLDCAKEAKLKLK